jgi:transcriptional regulator with XRE-family HTH domain
VAVHTDTQTDETSSDLLRATRARIMAVLEERGMTIVELAEASGISEGGFHSRFRDQSVQLRVLGAFAKALQVPVGYLLPDEERGEVVKRTPTARPYVEERVDALERELRQIKTQLKK